MHQGHLLGKLLGWAMLAAWLGASTHQHPPAEPTAMQDIQHFIAQAWDSLTRKMTNCATFQDVKTPGEPTLYLPADFPQPPAITDLSRRCPVHVGRLPEVIHHLGQIDSQRIGTPGLLYLPNPYVVPGGRFNEMYGWDSYFIIRGLLRDGRTELAQGMVENFLFEIDHYGGILNANRTYYLTRSQPPFFTSMIRAVYDAEQAKGRNAEEWLAKTYPYAVKDYNLWTHEPHLAGSTGLSRYFDFGTGPVPEMADAPNYYRRVAHYLLLHRDLSDAILVETRLSGTPRHVLMGPVFGLDLCAAPRASAAAATQECEPVEELTLSEDFYKGDRSMRESGFDTSFRFGPFSAATHHYAPVCLNSLLYKVETDLEWMSIQLGRGEEAQQWRMRAMKRREAVNRYLWDESRGLYMDYDFERGRQSSYVYATTFYPLWVGLAAPEQAHAVMQNLRLLEQPGGLAMSQQATGMQWDFPYGWAPVHLLAIEGMRRYGFNSDADRISYKFLSMVLENFRRDGTIREKYNVVSRTTETPVEAGYTQNVIGFGWTNGVFLALLHELPRDMAERLVEQ
jgi:alpha,alpha-trehalase